MFKKIIASCFCTLLSLYVCAQSEFKLPVSVSLSARYSPKQPFRKIAANAFYSNITEAVRVNVPMFQKFNPEKNTFFALIAQANGAYEQPTFRNYIQQRQFIKLGAGLTALYHFKKKHTLIGTFKAAVSEDQQTIYDPYYRTSGTILYSNRSTSYFSFLLGTTVANNYKGVVAFPIAGIQLRGKKSRFLMVFPLCFDYRYSITPKTAVGLRLAPKGNQSRFYTKAFAASPLLDAESNVRVRHIDLTAYVKLNVNRNASLCLQGGYMFANKIQLTTSEKIKKNRLQPGPFIALSFTYRFHKKTIAEINEDISDELDTDELNLYDVTIDDLINY